MNHERTRIMEKATARRRRREESKSVRRVSRKKGKALSAGAVAGLSEKVVDLAHETATQLGAFVKSAARKIRTARG